MEKYNWLIINSNFGYNQKFFATILTRWECRYPDKGGAPPPMYC